MTVIRNRINGFGRAVFRAGRTIISVGVDNAQTFVEMCLAKMCELLLVYEINALGLADLKAIAALFAKGFVNLKLEERVLRARTEQGAHRTNRVAIPASPPCRHGDQTNQNPKCDERRDDERRLSDPVENVQPQGISHWRKDIVCSDHQRTENPGGDAPKKAVKGPAMPPRPTPLQKPTQSPAETRHSGQIASPGQSADAAVPTASCPTRAHPHKMPDQIRMRVGTTARGNILTNIGFHQHPLTCGCFFPQAFLWSPPSGKAPSLPKISRNWICAAAVLKFISLKNEQCRFFFRSLLLRHLSSWRQEDAASLSPRARRSHG